MKIASKILSTLILILLIIALALFTVPRLFGIRIYNVISGSMFPAYKVGDLVYVQKVDDGKDIKKGDVITFMLNQTKVATHRVVESLPDNDTPDLEDHEKYLYVTKGDANPNNDGKPVMYRNVIGVVKFSVPFVGKILEFIQTTHGTIITVTALLAVIILTIIFNVNTRNDGGDSRHNNFGGGRQQERAIERPGFNKNFGKKGGIRERRPMPEQQQPQQQPQQREEQPTRGDKRVPPKGWGSGRSAR